MVQNHHSDAGLDVFSLELGHESLVLDDPGRSTMNNIKCVIIGTEKRQFEDQEPLNYVLLVAPVDGQGSGIYERVGVASLMDRYIDFARSISIRLR